MLIFVCDRSLKERIQDKEIETKRTMLRLTFQHTRQAYNACAQYSSNFIAKRLLNIHEYQGIALMNKFGVKTPRAIAASTPEEAEKAALSLIDGKELERLLNPFYLIFWCDIQESDGILFIWELQWLISVSKKKLFIFFLFYTEKDSDVVIKAQALTGGRGLGSLSSGLKGGVHMCDRWVYLEKWSYLIFLSFSLSKKKKKLCQ